MKILFVIFPTTESLGTFMVDSARDLGHTVLTADIRDAFGPLTLINRIRYRLSGRRPTYMTLFSQGVLQQCIAEKPDLVVTTGCAPLLGHDLRAIRSLGTRVVNISTDDPWARNHYAHWLISGLKEYDLIFSPRRDTFGDFVAAGAALPEYLPFAYHPPVHFRRDPNEEERRRFACDVMFYGGADPDRVALFSHFAGSDINLHLYGSQWDRYPRFRQFHKGLLAPEDIPAATAAAAVSICIGRRANRDSHAMRSYEAAAAGACLLVELSADHEALYGRDGDAVVYFRRQEDVVPLAKELLADSARRQAMRNRLVQLITTGHHTYADRLETIFSRLKTRGLI